MYSLLVSGEVDGINGGTFTVSHDRFLEFTSDPAKAQLRGLSNDAIECLKSWPCLLMTEGRTNEVACVARLVSMDTASGNVRIVAEPVPDQPNLNNDAIWRLRTDLDIEQFEFSRHHMAVKDRNLFGILGKSDLRFGPSAISLFLDKPLPAPPRTELIAAIDVIGKWGHSEIDKFLLEAGVPGLKADRTLGSRKDRATAIVRYAIENPASTTAENSLFSVLIVSRAEAESRGSMPASPHASSEGIEITGPAQEVAGSPNRVFVVHGRNEVARGELVDFLRSIGLEPIVLHDQPNMGRHLLTKFVDEAELVTFAVILMTDDDMGCVKGGLPAPRTRQNVILELGYFLSHLGQARVCAIKTPGLETPSDFDGIVYISMDDAQDWKRQLRRELVAAKMPVS